MPIHPRPMAETARPLRPSLRVFMMAPPEEKLKGYTLIDASPLQRIPVWGGHSCPLTWTLAKNQNNSCKIRNKGGRQECPPHTTICGPTAWIDRNAEWHSPQSFPRCRPEA